MYTVITYLTIYTSCYSISITDLSQSVLEAWSLNGNIDHQFFISIIIAITSPYSVYILEINIGSDDEWIIFYTNDELGS